MWWRRKMMGHPTREQLSALLDARLGTGEARWVGEHLSACTSCRGEMEDLRRVTQLLRRVPSVAPRRSFRIIATDVMPQQAPVPQRLLATATAVAVLALAVVLAVDLTAVAAKQAPVLPAVAGMDEPKPVVTSGDWPSPEQPKSTDQAQQGATGAVVQAPSGAAPATTAPAPVTSPGREFPKAGSQGSAQAGAPRQARQGLELWPLEVALAVVGAGLAGAMLWRRRTRRALT
jgi:hypothetical protein